MLSLPVMKSLLTHSKHNNELVGYWVSLVERFGNQSITKGCINCLRNLAAPATKMDSTLSLESFWIYLSLCGMFSMCTPRYIYRPFLDWLVCRRSTLAVSLTLCSGRLTWISEFLYFLVLVGFGQWVAPVREYREGGREGGKRFGVSFSGLFFAVVPWSQLLLGVQCPFLHTSLAVDNLSLLLVCWSLAVVTALRSLVLWSPLPWWHLCK